MAAHTSAPLRMSDLHARPRMPSYIECDTGRMKSSGDGHIQAINSESLKGKMVTNMTMEGGRTTTTKATFSSRWLGADCGSLKPK